MKLNEYQNLSRATDSTTYESIAERMRIPFCTSLTNMVEYMRGIEIHSQTLDKIKKWFFYGKDYSRENDYLGSNVILSQTAKGKIDARMANLIHGILGDATETGELLDALIKHLEAPESSKPDYVNIAEEVGDKLWYLARIADACGTTLEDIAKANLAKLHARYGDKFDAFLANNRDLVSERAVLDSMLKEKA